jgi:predicted signal transduction protein with EAL and GGDEF domain
MHDVALERGDPAQLSEEITRLRADIVRLESKVEELDMLAHQDPLVPLANRRGMLRELEMMIARHDRHGTPVAMLFVLSMILLVVALVAFLLEVRIAIAVLRIGSW